MATPRERTDQQIRYYMEKYTRPGYQNTTDCTFGCNAQSNFRFDFEICGEKRVMFLCADCWNAVGKDLPRLAAERVARNPIL